MTSYRYTALDPKSNEQSGLLEAASPRRAREQLAAANLFVVRLAPETHDPGLSAGGAIDLVAQVAELAKAGLPLPAGLRATAAELPRGRQASALQQLADRLDAGLPLEEALRATAPALPSYLSGLLTAAIASGQLPLVLEHFLDERRRLVELRRGVWSAIAYPLLVVLLLLGWILFMLTVVVPQMDGLYTEWDIQLPQSTALLMKLSRIAPKLVAAIGLGLCGGGILLWLTGGRAALGRALRAVPLVGPVWRYQGLTECCGLLAVLVEQQLPLPTVLQLASESLDDFTLRPACQLAAARLQQGQSLPQAIGSLQAFPHSLAPILDWGLRVSALGEALRTAADFYRQRAELQQELLRTVLPPWAFVLIGASMLFIVTALFLPLVKSLTTIF